MAGEPPILVRIHQAKPFKLGKTMEVTVISPTDPPRTTTHNLDAHLLLRRAKAFSQHIPTPSQVSALSTKAAPQNPNAKNEAGHAFKPQQPATALPPPIKITIPNADAQIFHHYVRLLYTAQIPILPAPAYRPSTTTSPSSRRYRPAPQPRPDTTSTTWPATLDQIQNTHLLLAELYLLATYTMDDAHGSNQVVIAAVQALNGLLLHADSELPTAVPAKHAVARALDGRLETPGFVRCTPAAPVQHVLPAHGIVDSVCRDARVAVGDALRRVYVAAFVRWGSREVRREARAEAEKLGDEGVARWRVFTGDVEVAWRACSGGDEGGNEGQEDRLLDWREFVVGWKGA